MNKGLESIKEIVKHNISFATKQIKTYKEEYTASYWANMINYYEGIKSTNESLLKAIEHEIKMYELEQQADMELDMFLIDDGLPISMAERI